MDYQRGVSLSLLLGGLLLHWSASYAQNPQQIMLSPKGTFVIAFSHPEKNLWANDEPMTSSDSEYFNIKYTISFTSSRTHQTFSASYHDIYGSDPPSSLADIAAALIWSPDESFVIFPEEQWQRAPGAPQRTFLNLTPSLDWKSATVRMEAALWLDSLTLIGNAHDDCDYSVVIFDGRTGDTTPLRKGSTPFGYTLVGMKNHEVIVKELLDNCASSSQKEKQFKPKIERITVRDIRTNFLYLKK